MNKTVTINISGIIFHIEEDAYNKLSNYLSVIKSCFKDSDGRDEIMSDIESRIAEMLQEKVSATKQVVLMTDVDHVISVMGQPDQFAIEGEATTDEKKYTTSSQKTEVKKRVYRNPDDKLLGGVCSGISAYFGIDPIWLRLAFPLVFFVWGSGLLVYILLWIIIPKAVTSTQKLEMRGEPVNIDNIKKNVEEETAHLKSKIKDFKKEIKEFNSKKSESALKAFIKKTAGFLSNLFTGMFKLMAKIIGFLLIMAALPLLIFAVFIFSVAPLGSMLSLGLIFFFGVPLLTLIYVGFKLLLQIKKSNRIFNFSLLALWLLGIAISMFYGYHLASDFSVKEKNTTTIALQQPTYNILYISSSSPKEDDGDEMNIFDIYNGKLTRSIITNSFYLFDKEDKTILGYPQLDIEPSKNDSFELELVKMARGRTSKEAINRAEKINYEFSQTDSLLDINSYFDIDKNEQWRNQQVRIILKLPKNKVIDLDESLEKIIYDIDNVTNTYDQEMLGHRWIMTDKGLLQVED